MIGNQVCDKHHAFEYVANVHSKHWIQNLIDCFWQFNADKISNAIFSQWHGKFQNVKNETFMLMGHFCTNTAISLFKLFELLECIFQLIGISFLFLFRLIIYFQNILWFYLIWFHHEYFCFYKDIKSNSRHAKRDIHMYSSL